MNVAVLKRENSFVAEKYYGNLVSDMLRFMKQDLHQIQLKDVLGSCLLLFQQWFNSDNKDQRDALFLNFILVKNSTCFGQTYCPSSGVLFTANGICHTEI